MATQKPQFDMDAALKALRAGKDLTGKDGVLTPLIKQLTEAALQADRDYHLAQDDTPSRKNGSTSKTVKSPVGSFELQTPRDRAGTFEPQLIKKHQTHLTDELERKILALFSLGMSYQDIRANLEDLYGIEEIRHAKNRVIARHEDGQQAAVRITPAQKERGRANQNSMIWQGMLSALADLLKTALAVKATANRRHATANLIRALPL